MSNLASGDRVTHPNQKDWGLGKVIGATADNLDVFFVGAGRKRIARSYVQLEKVAGAASRHRLLDNLIESSEMSADGFVTIPMAIERFMKLYPNGFDDPGFVAATRDGVLRGHKFCVQLLSQDELARLIAAGEHGAVCDRARHVEAAANLLTKSERKSLHDTLDDPASQKLFAAALAGLLHGVETPEARFKQFLRTLGILGLGKWPFATLFGFIHQPRENAFVKPTVIQNAARALCWRIGYKPEPNWKTYDAVLRLLGYVRANLLEEGLMPRDLMDVQSFVWAVGQK